MSNSCELQNSLQDLVLMGIRIDGNESFFSDTLDKLKEAGGKATDASLVAIQQASKSAMNGVIKTLGTRRMFIAHIHNRLGKDNLKDELTFNSSLLKKITRDGSPADIIDGLKDLQLVADQFKSFLQDVEAYYSKELNFLEKISSIKNTDDAVSILNGMDTLKFPDFKLSNHAGKGSTSLDLPGGKTIWFNETNGKAILVNVETPGEEVTESFAKDDVKSILTKLNKLVEVYQYVAKALSQYENYSKKFNTVLSKSFAHLDTLKGTLSVSLLSDLRSRLEGNAKVFSLYSGFLPQFMIYLDDYVDTLSSYLSKQFN